MAVLQKLASRLAHALNSFFRQTVCGQVCRNAVALRNFKDAFNVSVDAFDFLQRALRIIAVKLVSDIDDAAGIDDIVRGINDAHVVDLITVAGFFQLVVGQPRQSLWLSAAGIVSSLIVAPRAHGAYISHSCE